MTARWLGCALVLLGGSVAPALAQFPAELAGRVLDGVTSRPLEQARVSVAAAGLAVSTDPSGRFRMKGLPSGEWDVEITAIGYRAARMHAVVTDGRVEEITARLEPLPVDLAPLSVTGDSAVGPGVSVLSRARIDAAHAPDVAALLQAEPGVTVTQQGGAGAPATISIRGSASHEVLVLLDGVPLNDPTTGTVDLGSIPVEQLERITIVRGAAAARYGPRALAGAIVLERQRATATGGWLTLAAGAFGERTARAGGTLVATKPAGSFGASLTAGLSRFDGDFSYDVPAVRGGGIAHRDNGDGGTNSIVGSVRWTGRRSLTELEGDYLDVDRGLPGSIVQPTRNARDAEHRWGARFSTSQTLGPIDLRLAISGNQGQVRYRDPAPPAAAPYADSIRVRQLLATTELERSVGPIRLAAGAEGRWLGVEASNLTAGAPRDQAILSGWARAGFDPTLGGIHPSVRAGIRFDRVDHPDESRWSPSVSLGVPIPGALVQLSWSSAFAPPTFADQFFQPGLRARANPNLQAERVRNDWQLQVNTDPVGLGPVRFTGSLALFRADVDGMIIWFPDFQYIWSPNNYDVSRRGGEVAVTAFVPTADVTVSGALSTVAVEYRGPVLSGQVTYRPRTTGTASVSARRFGFDGTLRFRFIGRRRTVAGSDQNTLDPFSVTDFSVSRRLPFGRANVELTVGVDDLFDRAGTMLVDYPAPGRTWRLTVSVRGRSDPARALGSPISRSEP